MKSRGVLRKLAALGLAVAAVGASFACAQEREDPARAPLVEPRIVRPSDPLAVKADTGFVIKDAPLNDIFQFLAQEAQRQYVRHPDLNQGRYLLWGHLKVGDTYEQIMDIAFLYGLKVHDDRQTISIEPVVKWPAPDAEKPAAEPAAVKKDPILVGTEPGPEEEKAIAFEEVELNRLLQHLAKRADLQYFHNPLLGTPAHRVSGRLGAGKPLDLFKQLATHYGLSVVERKHTIYAMTKAQVEERAGLK